MSSTITLTEEQFTKLLEATRGGLCQPAPWNEDVQLRISAIETLQACARTWIPSEHEGAKVKAFTARIAGICKEYI